MAIYISSTFDVNSNIRVPILDSSWVYGSMVYADSIDELPTNTRLVRQGNLASVKHPLIHNKSILYQAYTTPDNKIGWVKLDTGSNSVGQQEVYYTPEELENLSESEYDALPDDILVVTDEHSLPENDLLNSLMNKVNQLQKEINRIKNTFNDISAVDIEDTNSNYGSYISFHQGNQPITEVDWKDSSNGNIVYSGTSSKFGTDKGINIDWVNPDSSNSWYEKWKDGKVEIFSSSVVNNHTYPYYSLPEDGIDPETNMLSDGADEKLTLRHFAPKYAKTYTIMNRYKTSLIPYELVLCLENNGLYYYNLNKNKMVLLAGGNVADDKEDDFELLYEIDSDGNLNITGDKNTVFVKDGILNIQGKVENGILLLNSIESEKDNQISVEDGYLNITTNSSTFIDADGYLNITTNIENGIINI